MSDFNDLHVRALQAWRQNGMSTAATPPAEWVTMFIVAETANSLKRVEERLAVIETRLGVLDP